MSLQNPSLAEIQSAILIKKRNKIKMLFPDKGELRRELYVKHLDFFQSGLNFRIRAMRSANRVGKTTAGAYETVCHLTGNYPPWWTGRRFNHPIDALVAGETGKLVRDSIQKELMGPPGEIGTGMIPYDCIIERRAKSGIPDAIDTARIKHKFGESQLQFQAYDQGREAFQATTRHLIWLDEEPSLAIYGEAITRTMTTGGVVFLTFTPLKGVSETVQFLQSQEQDGKIVIITATWDDAPHLSEKDKQDMLESYPPHQRDARSKGIPALGSGAIYPIPESEFIVAPIELPPHWPRVYGMDVGWNRTAALFAAIDKDADTLYFYSEHYRGLAEPSVHADAIKGRGNWMPGVIDPASRGRGQADGKQLFELYQALGLKIIEADNAREAGIYEVYQRLSSMRIKVFSNLVNFINEFRLYRRDEKGNIVKENDHLMDCVYGHTKVLTDKGIISIEDLVGTEGFVLSPEGKWVRYKQCGLRRKNAVIQRLLFSDGSEVFCTPDHLFLTPTGWEKAECVNEVLRWTPLRFKLLRIHVSGIWATIIIVVANISLALLHEIKGFIYTVVFGKLQILKIFLRDFMYIIRMETDPITSQQILNSLSPVPTSLNTKRGINENLRVKLSKLQKGGIGAWKDVLGTPNTVQNPLRNAGLSKKSVRDVVQYFRQLIMGATGSVIRIVRRENCENADVYCMEVPDGHAFVLANGLISHNCMRYIVMSGVDIAEFPPAWMEKTWPKGTSAHQSQYDPFSRQRIQEAVGGRPQADAAYNPLDRRRRF